MVVDPNATRWSSGAVLGYPHKFVDLLTLWLIRFTERTSCSLSSLKALWATEVGLGDYVVNRGAQVCAPPPPVCMLKNALPCLT